MLIAVLSFKCIVSTQHSGGRVVAYNAETGGRQWQLDCQDILDTDSCQDSVEAEFAVSPHGNLLLYGDIFGRIVALQIAASNLDSAMSKPTSQLAAVEPTIPKDAYPTESVSTPTPPTESTDSLPQNAQSAGKNESAGTSNVAGIAAGLAAGVIALALSVFLFVFRRRRKKATQIKEALDGSPSLAEVADNTCYLERNSERVSDHESGGSLSSLAHSFHGDNTDIKVIVNDFSIQQDKETEILASILHRDSGESEDAPPPPPPSHATNNDSSVEAVQSSSITFDDLSTRISSFTSTLSRTLSETNLASLESSVLPYLSFAWGETDEAAQRKAEAATGGAQEGAVKSTHRVENGEAAPKARYI